MEYSQYYLVKPAEAGKIQKSQAGPEQILEGAPLANGKDAAWTIVVTDKKLEKSLDVALDFHNDQGTAWGFELFHKGELVCGALFGENEESGVSQEDNYVEGSPEEMVDLLGLEGFELQDMLFGGGLPDVKGFAELLGFDIVPKTPDNFE